jgi:uncharacterized protein YqeY
MGLLDKLNDDMKNAMRERDALKTSVLRMAISDCKYAKVEKMRELTDDEIVAVVRKGIKSREDSESQYRNAGRADLADKEAAEAVILRTYVPQTIGGAELEAIVAQAIADTGAASPKDIGKVMKAVLGAHGARVDGKDVQRIAAGKLGAG